MSYISLDTQLFNLNEKSCWIKLHEMQLLQLHILVFRYIILKITTNNTFPKICFLWFSEVSDIAMASKVNDKCQHFFVKTTCSLSTLLRNVVLDFSLQWILVLLSPLLLKSLIWNTNAYQKNKKNICRLKHTIVIKLL